MTLQQQQIPKNTIVEVENNLDFILSHFSEEPLFPRKISNYKTRGGQFSVSSKQEIINAFRESNFVDCRINAFPSLTKYKGCRDAHQIYYLLI